jgi:hypothetical protein
LYPSLSSVIVSPFDKIIILTPCPVAGIQHITPSSQASDKTSPFLKFIAASVDVKRASTKKVWGFRPMMLFISHSFCGTNYIWQSTRQKMRIERKDFEKRTCIRQAPYPVY